MTRRLGESFISKEGMLGLWMEKEWAMFMLENQLLPEYETKIFDETKLRKKNTKTERNESADQLFAPKSALSEMHKLNHVTFN